MSQTTRLPLPTDKPLTAIETELHKLETEYNDISISLHASKEQTRVLESKSLAILQKLMPAQNSYLINIIQTLQQQQQQPVHDPNSIIRKINTYILADEPIETLLDSIV
jgi:hypothetical protein